MISLVLTARPSYAKLQTVIRGLLSRGADIELVACAGAVLERFGRVVDIVRADFPTLRIREVYSTLEGHNVLTSAKSTAGLLHSLADYFSVSKPAVVVVVADRYEVLAAAQAAAYQNIHVAHLQGGEVSGNIDNSVRDAITALATYHFPATLKAAERVARLTGSGANIWRTGCPSIDIAWEALRDPFPVHEEELGGIGSFSLQRRFIVVLHHPETEHPNEAYAQMSTILRAVRATELPAVMMWPGMDAGQERAAKALRIEIQQYGAYTIRAVRTLPPLTFLRLLRQSRGLVGNSSAGIRECSFVGTQVVNIGGRQRNRERAGNVLDIPMYDEDRIRGAILHQSEFGPEPMSTLYGHGNAGEQIAQILMERCM